MKLAKLKDAIEKAENAMGNADLDLQITVDGLPATFSTYFVVEDALVLEANLTKGEK